MKEGRAGWNFGNFITKNYGFCFKISRFNKSAGWNKDVQFGKFIKFSKVCCTTIRETKVHILLINCEYYEAKFRHLRRRPHFFLLCT